MSLLEPRANPSLYAHQAILERCLAQHARGTMHHAFLLTGAKGIGKATFAYHFARELLAQGAISAPEAVEEDTSMSLFGDALPVVAAPLKPTENVHAPESALFRRVAAGSHTDLLTIAPAYDAKKSQEKNEIGIDVARGLGEFLSLTPAESQWRVVIIDAVDQLNNNAANAILKLLEEPPAFSILLLVCHNPATILPTIRSRCQTIHFSSPDETDFSSILKEVAPDISAVEHPSLYRLACGSPGLAITLHAHKGLALYKELFTALRDFSGKLPPALEAVALAKTASSWQCFMHAFEMVALRVVTGGANAQEIFEGEASMIAACRKHYNFEQWSLWQCVAGQLLRDTNIYHLDKRHTLRMMCDVPRLLAA